MLITQLDENVKKRRANKKMQEILHAEMHITYLKEITDAKLEQINENVKSQIQNSIDIEERRKLKEITTRQLEEENRLIREEERRLEEERKWHPKAESDKFAYQLIQEWGSDFEKEKERFFHASFVLTWFIHKKFGICFTGGIERWGKDRGRLKPFGGRREESELREQTASRELYEETIGLVNISPDIISTLPHVFIMKTNPCYLFNVEVNHYEFRDRLKNEKNPSSLEMKAVVHVPFKQFYNLKLDQIPSKGVKVEDISGRLTEISPFFLHALRGFGFI
jgi:hypothetical protein